MARTLQALALAGICLALGVGCGPKPPAHNGYKSAKEKPWNKAKAISFDASGEAEVDGKLSWEKRTRARWYAIQVTEPGDIEVKVRAEPFGETSDEFDLAFELVNRRGKVLVFADKDEDDAGEEERARKLAELSPGVYWLHLYLQNRMQAASFNVRLKFEPRATETESTFPKEVAYAPKLAAVPPVDDAPPPEVARKCTKNCGGGKKPPKENDPPATSIKARIIGASQSGGGVSIRIGVGADRGVNKGDKGSVVTSGGKAITNGGFTVTKVTGTVSWANVSTSLDAVNSAAYARIKIKASE